MYQNQAIHLHEPQAAPCFFPLVINILQTLANEAYFHRESEENAAAVPPNCVSFFRCIAGNGKINTSDTVFQLSENESLFIPTQKILSCKSCAGHWAFRRVDFVCTHTDNAYSCQTVLYTPLSADEHRCFHSLLQAGAQHPTQQSYINALFLAYFYTVFPVDTAVQPPSAERHTAEEICAYMQQCTYEKKTVSEIAAFFSVTPRRLHQICIKKTGLSPKQYMQHLKMKEARRLLTQTKMPVHQIAELLCFNSPYHFSNAFRKCFQVSPQALRHSDTQKAHIRSTAHIG